MTKYLLGAIALTILNSCGMLNKLEEKTGDVYDELGATKEGQALGAAIEIMSDPEKSPNIRAAAAETVFVKAPEDRIFKYIGAPAPLERLSVPVPTNSGMVTLPNVSFVGDEVLTDAPIAPVNLSLHDIQLTAAVNLLKQMSVEAKMPGLAPERLDYLRSLFPRARNVSTAVVGSIEMDTVKELLHPKEDIMTYSGEESSKREKRRETQRKLKEETARLLRELIISMGLPESESTATEPLIEARLGVSQN